MLTPKEVVEICSPRPGMPYFVLGPFANRVSFVAQQTRAINLVYALVKLGIFGKDDEIAVIGGGVAGLTAAAAVVGFGAKADIYESGACLLPRQQETVHRVVNPTITKWPLEDLSETTRLPFLNWYQLPCNEVAQLLQADYDRIEKACDGKLNAAFRGKITKISSGAKQQVAVELDGAAHKANYRAVIVALGFGQEDTGKTIIPPGEWVGYWTPDNIVDTRNNNPKLRFIVSGAGDGGMIDMLRILHKEFDRGLLPLKVARLLEGTDLAKKIKEEEGDLHRALLPEAMFHQLYETQAALIETDDAYAEIKALLSRSYIDKAPCHVLVDSKLASPVSKSASAINKLLIYHARLLGRVEFVAGKVEKEGDEYVVRGDRYKSTEVRVIVRHGPVRDFGNCVNKNDLQFLEAEQMPRAEEMAVPIWDDELKCPPPYRSPDSGTFEFRQDHRDIAETFLNYAARRDIELAIVDRGYEVVGFPKNQLPAHAFGVPLLEGRRVVATPIYSVGP